MILDYNSAKGVYILRVPDPTRSMVKPYMQEHGLDLSAADSSPAEGVLFTREPCAAVTFWDVATPRAKENLAGLKAQIDASWKRDSSRHFAVPADKELWGFQKADLEYALARKNTLVGDQPGLGKTEVAIAYCNEVQAERVLIICPANIRMQWAERIHEWSTLPWQNRIVYPILKGKDGVHPRANYTITSYDLARVEWMNNELGKLDYDVLILDEPHYLKEATSKRTQAIFGGSRKHDYMPLAEKASNILGLTGTPLPNRPREAFTLAKGLCWDSIDWMNEDDFKDRFNPIFHGETEEGKRFTDEKVGRHYELQNRLRSNFMVRHEKHGPNGVMDQLQMPIYDLIRVDETRAVKEALEAEKFLDLDMTELEDFGGDIEVMGHISVLRRQMGVAMAPQIADYLDMLLESGEDKLTVFAWHIEVLDILSRALEHWGLVRIDGSTSASQKQAKVNRFIKDPDVHVCIGNILSMGTGTDGLQHVCNHGLIAEPDWVPGNNIQCFDRLDRGGQKRQVQGDIFVAPGSIAEKVLASALKKGRTIHKALDDRDGIHSGMGRVA
jgi:SWI/SNF-related matrix-associated actin-dependent regulator 1 of chromatin subfamily A